MESALLSPTTNTKFKVKESVMKMRYGSPKLQDVLRERCRQQMKEKRGQLFNKRRLGLEIDAKEIQDKLTEIVRKELDSLATTDWDESIQPFFGIVNKPLDPEEALELENEIIAEEEQWILEEYEKMSREELELLASTVDTQDDEVICPICQKFNLIQDKDYVKCKGCNFQLDSCKSIRSLGRTLNDSVGSHSNMCSQTPGFILIPENGKTALYLICQSCSLFKPMM